MNKKSFDVTKDYKSWLLDEKGQAKIYYDVPGECIEEYLYIYAVWDSQWLYINSKDEDIKENVIIYLVQCCVCQYKSNKFHKPEDSLLEYAKFFISPLDESVRTAFFTELNAFIDGKKTNWSEEEVEIEGMCIVNYVCKRYAYVCYDNIYKDIFIKAPDYNSKWEKVIKEFLKQICEPIDNVTICNYSGEAYCENKNYAEFREE